MPLILIIIGTILIIYNYRAIKREDTIDPKDDTLNISFQSILQDNKEDLNDYKIEIGILRRDIAESLTELQEEIVDIKNNLNKIKDNGKLYENKEDKHFLNENEIDSEISNDNNKEVEKINKIDQIIGIEDENLLFDIEAEDELIPKIDFSGKEESSKTQKIKKLLKDGLTEEQICHELSVSKGEVLLVKNLFKE